MADKTPTAEQQAKAQRLAAALRDNLHRRKAQDRARQAPPPAAPTEDPRS